MHFDLRRRLRQTHRLILMEVALDGPTFVDRDLVGHEVTQSLDDGSLHLADRVTRIDDLAADIAGHPDLVHLEFLVAVNADFRDFGEVSAVAEVERHTLRRAPRKLSAPPGLFGHDLEHTPHAPRVVT